MCSSNAINPNYLKNSIERGIPYLLLDSRIRKPVNEVEDVIEEMAHYVDQIQMRENEQTKFKYDFIKFSNLSYLHQQINSKLSKTEDISD